MDTNLDVPGIIKRAKQALNLKRDSELAEFLGVSRATVTNWAARNSIDFRLAARQIRKYGRLQLAIVGKRQPETPVEILRKRTGTRGGADNSQSQNCRTG